MQNDDGTLATRLPLSQRTGGGGARRSRSTPGRKAYVYGGPDDVAERYLELGLALGAPKPQSYVAMSGSYCLNCSGGPATTRRIGRNQPGRWQIVMVCSSCGAPWPRAEAGELVGELEVPKRWVQEVPRRGGYEASIATMIDEWRVVKSAIETRPKRMTAARWDLCIICWLPFVHFGLNFEEIVPFGLKRWPQFAPWWREWIVRASVARARKVVRARSRSRNSGFRFYRE